MEKHYIFRVFIFALSTCILNPFQMAIAKENYLLEQVATEMALKWQEV